MITVSQKEQAEFVAFRESCIWLRNCYNIYVHLFHGDEATEQALVKTAPLFFNDLSIILQEYFFLQVRKITDAPTMCGRVNLSVQHIDKMLSALGLHSPEIVALSDELHSYRGLTADISNRVAAHTDAETRALDQPVGAHSENALTAFLESMQSYTDLAGNALGVGALDYRTQAGRGDVLDLLRVLKRV